MPYHQVEPHDVVELSNNTAHLSVVPLDSVGGNRGDNPVWGVIQQQLH